MKKTRLFIILFVGLLLAVYGSSTTFAAKTYVLTVKNFTSKTLEIGLVGPENHLISLESFYRLDIELFPAVYQFSYYDCGKLFVDTVNMNKDREIKIFPCNASGGGTSETSSGGGNTPQLIDLVLNNKTYKQLTVGLVGSLQNYSFDLPPGKTFVSVFKDTYQFSYYDCGQLNVSTVKITKDDTQIKILNCGQGQGSFDGSNGDAGTDSDAPASGEIAFAVKNDTYSSFDLLFSSDLVYTFNVIPGKNKVSLLPGTYRYSYYACGELWVGTIVINKNTENFHVSSCSSGAGRPDTGQNIIFKVKNLTGAKFTITFDGPQFYTLEVKAGASTIFEIEKGYYSFQYYACGAVITGEIFLKDGVTLKTVECSTD